jgi:hypothetical protein
MLSCPHQPTPQRRLDIIRWQRKAGWLVGLI